MKREDKIKLFSLIYKYLYLLLYNVIMPIRHGAPFVAILRDEEAIAVPGG